MRLRTKYIIIDVALASATDIVRFSKKIPEDFVIIDGYAVTSQNEDAVTNGVLLGTLSLSLNSKDSTPVFDQVRSSKVALNSRKFGFTKLLEPTIGGALIDGYFAAANPAPGAFSLKIYLKGKQLIKNG